MRPGEQPVIMTERELASLRNLYALKDGWPFGEGPMQWFCHLEIRVPDCWLACDQACEVSGHHCWNWHRPRHKPGWHDPQDCRGPQADLMCRQCPQSIFCLNPDIRQHQGFTWNLELLKSRIADHVLKVHPEAAT